MSYMVEKLNRKVHKGFTQGSQKKLQCPYMPYMVKNLTAKDTTI